MKPRIYLDKSAVSMLDLDKFPGSQDATLVYSKALLLDLKNDLTDSHFGDLESLNRCGGIYLYSVDGAVFGRQADAHCEFKTTNREEINLLAPLYRFFNGGGSSDSLWDELRLHLERLLSKECSVLKIDPLLVMKGISDMDRVAMQAVDRQRLRSEMQRSTGFLARDKDATLETLFSALPKYKDSLEEVFPSEVPKDFEGVFKAAIALGAIQLGQDKGITSPKDDRSLGAAERGLIDCMHIAFGLHCEVFVSADINTVRRFKILSEHWRLNRIPLLIAKEGAN